MKIATICISQFLVELGSRLQFVNVRRKMSLKIRRDALRFKKEWIVQKRFDSQPILTEDGRAFHLCLGVFVIDGKFAGIYGRISSYARIDEKAQDLPVLIHRKRREM